jgi:serine phosphatase RsbU (regulator of sigma subunit)
MNVDNPDRDRSIRSLRELIDRLGSAAIGLTEILDSLGEAVTIRNPRHEIIYANRRAAEQMHFDSVEELVRAGPISIMSEYVVQDEHGNELTMDDMPSVRQLAGEPASPLLIRTVHRETGEVKWDLLKATVLRDQGGEPIASVMIIEDVTLEKTAELRARFLARATDTLMSSLDYQETLRNVAWLAVPEVADWCAVDLVDETGARQQVVVAHRDPEKLVLAERLRTYDPDPPDPDQGIGRVIRTGTSELYPDITDDMLRLGAQDGEHLRLLLEVGFRSALLVPLRTRGRTLGVLTLVTAESMRHLDETDREFAEQIADRAAIAVDNARLATGRREIAVTLQRTLLPDAVPAIPGWEVATMYRAASASDEVEVGGDFYDFFPTPSGWIVLLGDVTGRGVEAAAMTSLVRHGARFLAKQEHAPSGILNHLDEALREQLGLSLCSALCVRLQDGGFVMSSAGHPPPLVVRDDGRIREIGGSGPILGGWDDSSWEDREVQVGPDEMLLMYTDGVTDTRGESERFGAVRLRRLLAAHAGASPSELLSGLQAALDEFQNEGHADDTGAVALRPAPVESLVSIPGDVPAALDERSPGDPDEPHIV